MNYSFCVCHVTVISFGKLEMMKQIPASSEKMAYACCLSCQENKAVPFCLIKIYEIPF